MKKINLLLLMVSLISTNLVKATVADVSTVPCIAGHFEIGKHAAVTCCLQKNTTDQVFITFYPVNTAKVNTVLACFVDHVRRLTCDVDDGYDFNKIHLNNLTLEIPEVTESFVGRYACHLAPLDLGSKPTETCSLFLKGEKPAKGAPTVPIEPDDVSANTDKVSMPDTNTGVSTTSSTLPRDQDRYPVTATKPEPPVHTSAHTYDSFVLFGGLGGVLLLVLVLFGILLRRTARQPMFLSPPLPHNVRREIGIAVDFRQVPPAVAEDHDSCSSVSTHLYDEIPDDTEKIGDGSSTWQEAMYQNTTNSGTNTDVGLATALASDGTAASGTTLPSDYLHPIASQSATAAKKNTLPDDYLHPVSSSKEAVTAKLTLPHNLSPATGSLKASTAITINRPNDYLHPVSSRKEIATANTTLSDDYLHPVSSRKETATANTTLSDDYLHPVSSRKEGATANTTLSDDYLHPVTSRQEGATANSTMSDDYLHPISSRKKTATTDTTMSDDYLHPISSRKEGATANTTLSDDYLHPVSSRKETTTANTTLSDDYLHPISTRETSSIGARGVNKTRRAMGKATVSRKIGKKTKALSGEKHVNVEPPYQNV